MSVQFNVSQFLKSDVGDTRSYDFQSDEPIDLEDASATEVSGRVKFTMTNFGVVATGKAHAVLHLICARCLEPFETPVDISFEEEFQPSIDIDSGMPVTAPRNDAAFEISANHTIDLTEVLGRQGICLRAGHHCTQPLHRHLGLVASNRLSVAAYNTIEEIDRCIAAIEAAGSRLRR